jgi:membrane protein implicated in regulation of membrane protease activity
MNSIILLEILTAFLIGSLILLTFFVVFMVVATIDAPESTVVKVFGPCAVPVALSVMFVLVLLLAGTVSVNGHLKNDDPVVANVEEGCCGCCAGICK